MKTIYDLWLRLDDPVKRSIARFYVAFLGILYLLLFVLGVFLTAKRAPFADWYLQRHLAPYFKLALFVMFIGVGSITFGFFRLMFFIRTFLKKDGLVILGSAFEVPATMYFLVFVEFDCEYCWQMRQLSPSLN